MKKTLLIVVLAVLAVLPQAKAQRGSYSWGAGVRVGADYGITVKKYMGSTALDFMGIIHNDGFQVSGLYEWQKGLGNGFTFYYGLGASIGVWNDNDDNSDFGLAIDGIAGVEWKIPSIPFTLSLDWKPSFELIPNTDFYAKGFALSFKYVW